MLSSMPTGQACLIFPASYLSTPKQELRGIPLAETVATQQERVCASIPQLIQETSAVCGSSISVGARLLRLLRTPISATHPARQAGTAACS